jgi:transposase-like protein
MQKRRSAAERWRLVEEYRASGMTRKQFCELHELSLTTPESWKRAERTRAASPQLVAVKVEAAAEGITADQGFTLHLANGRRIDASWEFQGAEQWRLIRLAEGA